MAKKVLLFLSKVNIPKEKKTIEEMDECEYTGTDGSRVTGRQSNEAPVKYLLHRYPDISEVICVVTEEARKTALDWFKKEIEKVKPDIKITEIPCEGENSKTFTEGPMQEILKEVSSGDEILLDTTGGFRNAVSYMLLITRVLSYSEIPVTAAVYSNYQEKAIEDISDTMGLFDLVEGMQEMTSFGSINSIRKYYERSEKKDEKIESMLQAVEELTETITLCRTELLDEKTEQFNCALREAQQSQDALFRQMLTAFRDKFGGEWNELSILKWCVESGMIQQALTIYTERIPGYLMKKGFLQLEKPSDREEIYNKLKNGEYEDPDVVLFLRDFLVLVQKGKGFGAFGKMAKFQEFLKDGINQFAIAGKCKTNQNCSVRDICNDRELETGIRNTVNFLSSFHFSGPVKVSGKETKIKVQEDREKFQKKYPVLAKEELLQWIDKQKNTWPKEMNKMLNSLSEKSGMDAAAVLLEMSDEEMKELQEDKTVLTLKNMERLAVPGSGYRLGCSCEKMKKIAMDYLYIKRLRNMTNHANADSVGEKERILDYLYEMGYPNLEKTTVKGIVEMIQDSIRSIEDGE